jgi:hypothetical protein
MKYDAYRYLWPPRPETKIPPALIGFYGKRGWWGQVKKNGTCTVIFSHGDDVVFKTRHDDDHKAWAPQPEHAIFFNGREQWNVYVAELLHSKTANVKNHLYLFDILVSDGEDLSGTSFADRQAVLLSRYPGNGGAGLGATRVTEQVSRATCYTRDFERVWSELAAEDEGIVFKDPASKLAPCVTQTANAMWQVKCRRPTTNYSF